MEVEYRPGWDAYFLGVAESVARRADCRRSRVGAVIVSPDRRIVSTGYNGSPPGAMSCLEGACPRGLLSYGELPALSSYSTCIALHAERNAILYAPRNRLSGAVLYVTREPCSECRALIDAVGISDVRWPQ